VRAGSWPRTHARKRASLDYGERTGESVWIKATAGPTLPGSDCSFLWPIPFADASVRACVQFRRSFGCRQQENPWFFGRSDFGRLGLGASPVTPPYNSPSKMLLASSISLCRFIERVTLVISQYISPNTYMKGRSHIGVRQNIAKKW